MAIRTRIVLALTALALLLPGSALAGGWTGFATVPSTGTIGALKFATDSSGNEVAVWAEPVAGGTYKVLGAVRPPGASWTAAQQLDSGATTAPITDLAVDPAGNFMAIYTHVAATRTVLSSYLPAGQTTFDPSQAVGGAAAATINAIAVALAPNGTAYAVTGVATGGANAAASRPVGSAPKWTAMSVAGLPTTSAAPMDMTVTGNGIPMLADTTLTAGGPLRHTRWTGAAWQAVTTPASGQVTGTLVIRPSSNNSTTTLYQIQSTATGLAVQRCPTTVGAPCDPTRTLFNNGTGGLNNPAAQNPSISVDPTSGNAIATWTENTNVKISRRTGDTGSWSPKADLDAGTTPASAIDSTGGVVQVYGDANNHLQFLFAPNGGALTPPASALTDPAQAWLSPTLATDASGNTYGVWLARNATGAQSAVYDATPPSTPTLTAPANALVGDALSFGGDASDTWGIQGYSWDFGDGSTGNGASVTHAYSAPGDYIARVTATDNAGNQSSQTQTVSIAAQPTQPQQQPQQQQSGPAPLARPIAGQTVNLEPVEGIVLVRVPGSNTFVPLVTPTQVRDGSIIDARKGRVRITIDNGRGGLDTAEFFGGIFQFFQPKVKPGQTWFANLYLYGGSFKGCPAAPKNPKIAKLSRTANKKAGSKRSVRHLWGSGKGAFRTVGRYSAATVRGTTWLTDDRCDGTLTKVTAGIVGVRDFVLNKTVVVRKGKQYLAKPKPKAKAQSQKR